MTGQTIVTIVGPITGDVSSLYVGFVTNQNAKGDGTIAQVLESRH